MILHAYTYSEISSVNVQSETIKIKYHDFKYYDTIDYCIVF